MGEDVVGQVGVDSDLAATVGPTPSGYGHTDGRRVARRRLDVYPHYATVAGQTLRANTDFIEAILQQLFHHRSAFVRMAGAHWTQDRQFG
ncbi:hypothetical protein D3C86_2030770 [compost metagenome]